MSIRTDEDAPKITGEADFYDDLIRLNVSGSFQTNATNFDGTGGFDTWAGGQDLGTMLELDRNEVVELVAIEDYRTTAHVDQGDNLVENPGSIQGDISYWLRPTQSSTNPFLAESPESMEDVKFVNEAGDEVADGSEDAKHTLAYREKNYLLEMSFAAGIGFEDEVNTTGGGNDFYNQHNPLAKNYREIAGRGRICLPGDQLGFSSFVEISNVANGDVRISTSATFVFDVFVIEEETPTYVDILKGSSQVP